MLVGVMSESKLVSVECVNGSIKCREGGREREREREKQRKKLSFQRNEAMQP